MTVIRPKKRRWGVPPRRKAFFLGLTMMATAALVVMASLLGLGGPPAASDGAVDYLALASRGAPPPGHDERRPIGAIQQGAPRSPDQRHPVGNGTLNPQDHSLLGGSARAARVPIDAEAAVPPVAAKDLRDTTVAPPAGPYLGRDGNEAPPPLPPKVIDPANDTIDEPPYGTMQLRIIVLTYDRGPALRRLLTSLAEAEYFNETAHLDIWVDRLVPPPPSDAATSGVKKGGIMMSTLNLGGKNGLLRHHKRGEKHDVDVVEAAEYFEWPHGVKAVHLRPENAGLARQWHETWNTSLYLSGITDGLTPRTREKVVILEDDMEVSPHFWRWVRWCHHAYGDRSDFAACTLRRLRICAAECGFNLEGGPHNATPNFMYPLEGSWGYSPSAAHWVRFTSWVREDTASTRKLHVQGLIPTWWYKNLEKKGECPGKKCVWTQHHIKYVHTHEDRYTVYARGGGKAGANRTLGANWMGKGMHYFAKETRSDYEKVTEWDDNTLGRFDADPTRLNWSAKPTGGGEGLETLWTRKHDSRAAQKETLIFSTTK